MGYRRFSTFFPQFLSTLYDTPFLFWGSKFENVACVLIISPLSSSEYVRTGTLQYLVQ
jgi:hypothetical protein